MPDVNLLLAFAAGVLGFLSPCIVPLIPGYLSFVSGLSLAELSPADRRQHRVQVVLGTVVFVIGFASVFTALGASATVLGNVVLQNRVWLSRIGAPARPPDRNSQRGISRRYGHGVNVRPDLPIEYVDPPAVSIPAGHLIDPGA